MAVVWEVPAGTASDLTHADSGKRNDPLADSSQLDVLHRQIARRRKHKRMIGAHRHTCPWPSTAESGVPSPRRETAAVPYTPPLGRQRWPTQVGRAPWWEGVCQ